MIKLASLLIVHRLSTATLPDPPPVLLGVLSCAPSQFTRLMGAAKVEGPWTQVNQPDGSYGQRVGTNYLIPPNPNNPAMFFKAEPVQ